MLCCLLASGEERASIPLKGKVTEDSIKDLLKGEKLPPTIEFNDGNSQKIFGSGVDVQVCKMYGCMICVQLCYPVLAADPPR